MSEAIHESQSQDPIHAYFGLSYAHYLVLPRSVLQSMDPAWQTRLIACLQELDATMDWRPVRGRYVVQLEEPEGMVPDPLLDYERGRRRLSLRDDAGPQGKPWDEEFGPWR